MLNSHYKKLVPVELPYAGRQLYMGTLDAGQLVMPKGYEDYHVPVTDLLAAAGIDKGTVFMTVDEKIVQPGMSQRRPGPHVDGCFRPGPAPSWHHDGWNHYCNHLPVERMPVIVAASVAACQAWAGQFDAAPRNDGDLSHLELGEGTLLPADVGFLLSPDCVHESLPMKVATKRTFLRLALPVGSA